MTNTPAMEEMPPILNSAPADAEAHQEEKEDTEMTKEEIQELVRSTVEELLAARAENACSDDEKDKPEAVDAKPDAGATASEDTPTAEDTPADPDAPADPETPADPDAPADPDSPGTSTTDAEPKAEEKKEEEKEVIKEEVLNQAPENAVLNAEPEWKKLHGRAFFQYITSHPEVCKS